MINITQDEIQQLLNHYKANTVDNKEKTTFRSPTKKLPPFIIALDAFVGDCNKANPESHELTPEQLFGLLKILLTRKIRTHLMTKKEKQSEMVAQKIEATFGKERMAFFRLCHQAALLNQEIVNFACKTEDIESFPKEMGHVKSWLKENKLPDNHIQSEIMADPLTVIITKLEQGRLLSPYLSKQALGRASAVSKGFHGLFKPILDIKAATQLGQYVVYANLEKAEQMIITNPSLLTVPVTVTDYSDRQVFGTALRLALAAKDVRFHENEIAMVEMITGYLSSKFPNGKIILAQQINEQFPAGWEAEHEARIKRDQAALDAFVAAIAGAEEPDVWEAAAVVYREHFDNENKNRGVIKTGFHNNEQAVVAWFKAYDDNYVAFGNDWLSPKSRFFWQKGSACERHLTAADAMALARDIDEIVKKDGRALDRCLDFLRGGRHFYPLDSDPRFLIGVNCAASARGGYRDVMPSSWAAGAFYFQDYVKQKEQRCAALCESAAQTLKQSNSIPRSSTPK